MEDREMRIPMSAVYDYFECDGDIIYLLDRDKMTDTQTGALLFMKMAIDEKGEQYLQALPKDKIKRATERYEELRKLAKRKMEDK